MYNLQNRNQAQLFKITLIECAEQQEVTEKFSIENKLSTHNMKSEANDPESWIFSSE